MTGSHIRLTYQNFTTKKVSLLLILLFLFCPFNSHSFPKRERLKWLQKFSSQIQRAKLGSEKAELLYLFGPPQNLRDTRFLLSYLLHPHGLVRDCVIYNLSKTSHKDSRRLLRKYLSSRNPKLLLSILKIFQKMKDKKALPQLWKLLKVKQEKIRLAVLDCLSQIPHPKSISLCIRLLGKKKLSVVVRKRILFALFQMTGYSFPSYSDWKKFWKTYKSSLKIGKVYDPCDPKIKNKKGIGKTILVPQGYGQRFGSGRRALIQKYGGSPTSEQAVFWGLDWLKGHQDRDGKWSTLHFDIHCKGRKCQGKGRDNHDVGLTGLALLAYLGAGQTHLEGAFRETVKKGLLWLKKQQNKKGAFSNQMYDQGIATFAIAEAYLLTRECWLRHMLQKGVRFICEAQTPESGWRYRPKCQDADISVTGWQIMALASARKAKEIHVPLKNLIWAAKYLDALLAKDSKGRISGLTHYRLKPPKNTESPKKTRMQPIGGSLATSAVGAYCRYLLGENLNSVAIEKGISYFAPKTPKKVHPNHPQFGSQNRYFWYYAFLILFQKGNSWWKKWNKILPSLLVKDQIKYGCAKGSFPPDLQWGQAGGRVYSTAISILILEVYYRYGRHHF